MSIVLELLPICGSRKVLGVCPTFAKSVRKRGEEGKKRKRTGDQAAAAAYPSLAALALVAGANLPLVSGSGGRSDRELLLRPICNGAAAVI